MSLRGLRNFLDGISDTVDAAEGLGSALRRLTEGRGLDLPMVGVEPAPGVIDVPQLPPMPPLDAIRAPSDTPVRKVEVKSIDDRVKHIIKYAQSGREDPRVREFAIKAVSQRCGDQWCASEEDNWKECQALFAALRKVYRYTGDVVGADTYQHPSYTLRAGGGDCLPIETLVLRDDFSLIHLGALSPGDRIAADNGWVTVSDAWATGEKQILEFDLSNGCTLRCSPDHRVFLHGGREVTAGEIKVGDDLMQGGVVPEAADPLDWPEPFTRLSEADRAWLLGVFVADGWVEYRRGGQPFRVAVSGLDGAPKEEQKRRVVAMVESLGLNVSWARKYVRICNVALARFLSRIGTHAANKSLIGIPPGREAVEHLLEGLSADAHTQANGLRIYGTTSPALALQLRVLYLMLGLSTHISRVVDHGGFGKNPIYRITPRRPGATRGDLVAGRVRAIRDGGVAQCADTTVDGGRFWLPEADVIVHNCDCAASLIGACYGSIGYSVWVRVIETVDSPNKDWDHIYNLVGLPRDSPVSIVPIDLAAIGKPCGWSVPDKQIKRKKDYRIP